MSEIYQHIDKFTQIFAKELTPQLADTYVASLIEKLGDPNQGLEEIVHKGELLHQHVGENIYGPLIAGYIQWVEDKCGEAGHTGPVFFALRDAAPLETAAKVLWNGKAIYPVGVYANRPMLMIEDEIAPEWASANGKVVQYLGMLGLAGMEKVVWSDTGAWGTVVKALKVGLLNNADFLPLFWYSHNPHISGYINSLLPECGIDEKFGEVLVTLLSPYSLLNTVSKFVVAVLFPQFINVFKVLFWYELDFREEDIATFLCCLTS